MNGVVAWLGAVATAVLSAVGFAAVPDWENPAVVGRNKEPGRCTSVPFSDVATALGGERDASRSPTVRRTAAATVAAAAGKTAAVAGIAAAIAAGRSAAVPREGGAA